MRRLALLVLLSACGPSRDQSFFRLLQLSAVDKLQVANQFVYYAEGQALKRVAAQGGSPQVVSPEGVLDFAVTEGHAYAATAHGVLHYTVAPSGDFSLAADVAQGSAALVVAADAAGVSWLSCTELGHAGLDGADRIVVPLTAPCSTGGTRLALDSSTAYGIDAHGEWWASRSGGAPQPFATRQCSQLAAAGGWLYCASSSGLSRLRPFGTPDENVLTGNVRSFAVSDAKVYASLDDSLVSSPRNSTRVEVLGTYAAISAVALDAANVYFVNTQADLGLMLRTAQ